MCLCLHVSRALFEAHPKALLWKLTRWRHEARMKTTVTKFKCLGLSCHISKHDPWDSMPSWIFFINPTVPAQCLVKTGPLTEKWLRLHKPSSVQWSEQPTRWLIKPTLWYSESQFKHASREQARGWTPLVPPQPRALWCGRGGVSAKRSPLVISCKHGAACQVLPLVNNSCVCVALSCESRSFPLFDAPTSFSRSLSLSLSGHTLPSWANPRPVAGFPRGFSVSA